MLLYQHLQISQLLDCNQPSSAQFFSQKQNQTRPKDLYSKWIVRLSLPISYKAQDTAFPLQLFYNTTYSE